MGETKMNIEEAVQVIFFKIPRPHVNDFQWL